MCTETRAFRQTGITLVEQIVFMVVISVGVVGLLATMGPSLRSSADPQLRKQQQAIAESLLSEILHQPFTFCDPDDPAAIDANSAANCTTTDNDQDNQGNALTSIPANTETRFGGNPGTQFDNVADYAGYQQANVTNLVNGVSIPGYTATVAITRIGANYGLPAGAALQINVTVTGNGADPFILTGYRFRYAPRY